MGGKRKRGAKTQTSEQQPSRKKVKNGERQPSPVPAPAPADLALDKSAFAEKLNGDDRKREAKLYELLGSYDSAEHIAAADALITGLLNSPEPVLQRHLEKRLFRGLASSRNASRVGFSLVLTEILSQLYGAKRLAESKFPGLTFEKVLGTLVAKTQPSGSLPGQEERDYYFGQLFGFQCFVEANILFGDDSLKWTAVLDLVLKLANKKNWLRSHCAWVIVQSLPQMGQDNAWKTLMELIKLGLGRTAEGVGIWLKAAKCYPGMKMPTRPWTNPLSPKSIPDLANVLKESVKQDNGTQEAAVANASSSTWNSQLHFVWDLILEHFLESPDPDNFRLFWSTVVDDGLFSKNATEGQKFRGFLIFQKFLHGLAASKHLVLVKHLCSRNLLKCSINQAAKKDRYLHRAAVKSLKNIVDTAQTERALVVPLLTELLGKDGACDFDQRTNSKTIEKLLHLSKEDDTDAILAIVRQPVVSIKSDDDGEIEKIRRAYVDNLFKICTIEKGTIEEEVSGSVNTTILEAAVREMAICAYSKADGEFHPELSDKTREYCRSRLQTAFAKLTKRREDYRYLCNAVISVEPSAVPMSADIEAERKAALKALRKLIKSSAKSKDEGSTSLGLALLYAITILQLYNGDADALSTLADLKQCTDGLKEADDAASGLLIEILLSLVSQQSPMMRQITQQVFEAFTTQFSADALERLTDPLVAEENIKGQQALFDAEDDLMEDAEESDEDESDGEEGRDDEDDISDIGLNVEFVTLNGADQDGTEGSESDEESNGDDEKAAQDLADFDEKLAGILRSHRLDKDKDAETSDDDSDMSDSEMFALEPKLAAAFQHQVKKPNKKKENKDAKETMIVFKHRILDFLDIYVKKESNNPLAFGLLLPLLELIRTTITKELANKGLKVISDFSDAFKKAKAKSGRTESMPPELLRKILQEAPRGESHVYARAISVSSLLGASSLSAAGNAKEAWSIYAETVGDWLSNGVKVQPAIFSDWTNWLQASCK